MDAAAALHPPRPAGVDRLVELARGDMGRVPHLNHPDRSADALELARKIGLELAPVMIYADDVTHIVTEEGIANLLLCRDVDEREQAIRGVAGYTEVGRGRDRAKVEDLRARGIIRRPEDLGIEPLDADRALLAAKSIKDLVHWSGGLYEPPAKFRNW